VPGGGITKRQQQALDLRVGGKGYVQIGKEMGISDVAAFKLVERALQHRQANTAEKIERVLEVELARLDQAMQVCVTILEKKTVQVVTKDGVILDVAMDDELRLKTLDRIVKIQERRAKLLGMERTKVDATVDGPWASFLADVITGESDGEDADAAE
jgi:hypothetical protein